MKVLYIVVKSIEIYVSINMGNSRSGKYVINCRSEEYIVVILGV